MGRLITFVLLIGAALAIFFIPTRSVLQSTEPLIQERDELALALNNAEQIRAVRDELQSKYNNFRTADIEKVNKLLPSHVDSVRLIIDINRIANQYGMEATDVRFGSRNPDDERILVTPSGDFSSLDLSFSVTGEYNDLKAFLIDLERSLRIMDITNIAFDSTLGEPYTYTIQLQTYWLNDSESNA